MKTIRCLLFLAAVFAAPDIAAQQAVTASGGEASGSGGSASVSAGQVVYTTISGSGGVATQGVQQPYEFFVLGKDDYKSITLNAIVYPNPAISNIALRIDHAGLTGLRYELFDLNGRLLYQNNVKDTETIISMELFPEAVYILKVYSAGYELKTFKIVKDRS
ncbi:T9SS type A sorting domain-containing protein [Flavobacterium sp. Sd200]|uniref:T9SS type A sorting domain-containing protein n=1 Tax=Flavobacterium sp. Sd200 TaxID=2692211 RepID=UPI00136E0A53|nr:T9SS type A sorting domain-containing protein [Flavobacterium sp. Sd200]MXN91183.1 T9SS type A sorting domain-containing protein [Flavobacterium sp. Sd200]